MDRMSREAKDPRTRTWAEANGPEDSIKTQLIQCKIQCEFRPAIKLRVSFLV